MLTSITLLNSEEAGFESKKRKKENTENSMKTLCS